jgi:CheY-like chemotaxis protein
VTLAVRDTGIGMDATTQARIFEPFFTTKPVGEGTGLGLATVHGIVQQSNGHVSVESAPGAGSVFRIHLPRVDDTPAARALTGEYAVIQPGTETILLVEDEPEVRTIARRILAHAGYHVLEAASGAEALRLIDEERADVALLVTDIVMPEMSGRELARHVRAGRPETAVLFLSGYARGEGAPHERSFEPDTFYLQKPFTPETLTRKVHEALEVAARVV